MAVAEAHVHALDGLRLVSARTGEHVGACPHCRAGRDRYHLWTQPGAGGRPAWRFWCRGCGASGVLGRERDESERAPTAEQLTPVSSPEAPRPAHIPRYRQLYELAALWAHGWLLDEANPEPLRYLARRGVTRAVAERHMLGYALHDPLALVAFLREHAPALLPDAVEAGLLVIDRHGALRTHWHLCGALLFPTIADGQVTDLRARQLRAGAKTKSLTGAPADRGAVFPFGWDECAGAEAVILTESGEFKTLVPLAAYHAGALTVPTIGVPGLHGLPPDLGARLRDHGVRSVIMGFDSQPRPIRDGVSVLAPEELWSIRHGQELAAAGLEVRVLRLPLSPADRALPAPKADLDAFLLQHGPDRLQRLLDDAPSLDAYIASLPQSLLRAAKIDALSAYPTHRARPRQIRERAQGELPGFAPATPVSPPLTLDAARAEIRQLVSQHAQHGAGFLVLAHPPGAGKGHNTLAGLADFLRADPDPGFIVWAGLRKDQHADQRGLPLVPLHGRHAGNCQRLPESQELSRKGYGVRAALCQRRCPHVGRCGYLRQFDQAANFFAALPLLQATRWWREAGVVVLDEFDPGQLARIVSLTSAELAAMLRASMCPHAARILGWLGLLLASCAERAIGGTLLLQELEALADTEGLSFSATLARAIDALPEPAIQAGLPQLPPGATLADYQALPPGYLAALLGVLDREQRRRLAGQRFTSRIELRHGRLALFLRVEHVVAQLAEPAQPKIILDGTASPRLLAALFPHAPIQIEQPTIAGAPHVIQVLGQDWAKSTLHGRRRERWYDAIAAHIRPERPTLVVCTAACEAEVRQALAERGHAALVRVGHYGGLRGSNAYIGHDVILAQVYHPNREELIRTARALFADDAEPLDERMVLETRTLTDTSGAAWAVEVPTFADARLAALLESRREAELAQAALRGRPWEHPQAQITILGSLPLPGLTPTTITLAPATPRSNTNRAQLAFTRLQATARQLLLGGRRLLDATLLAEQAELSVATVRKHWAALAGALHLRAMAVRTRRAMPRGGVREQSRAVLVRRGRYAAPAPRLPDERAAETVPSLSGTMIDHAHSMNVMTSVIDRSPAWRCGRRSARHIRTLVRHRHPPASAP